MRLAAVPLLALAAACSTAITFDEPLPADPGPDVGGKALQEAVFADGGVTSDEYERAFAGAVECMRAEGFDIEGPLHYPYGPLAIEAGADPRLRLGLLAHGVSEADGERFGQVNQRCTAQWSYAIEQVYLRQFAPSREETRAWLERAWACLADKGISISNPPTEEEALDSVAYGCEPWNGDG